MKKHILAVLLFALAACASAQTCVQGRNGGTGNCSTSFPFATTRIPFSNATILTSSANLTFDSAAIRLSVGSGSSPGVAGLTIGAISSQTAGFLHYTGTASPSGSNYVFASNESATNINGSASVDLRVGNVSKLGIVSTAGAGPSITAGTATTDVQALSLTQTWNAGGVGFTAIKLNVTNTASAATAKLFDLQIGGTSAFTVGKDSLTFGSAIVTPASTGVRFLCISTTGVVTSQAAACVGT